ncbi:hypothetical protein E2C01_095995 [Portunus trituberculatus]|uniref:Uncharacterized protein n=1 Tax=Portunus trituberculatus TaxID=210409 RepID=A0A5B7K0N5_PORTR|nr:hypothetical protein [Portunus trituberculatus]
MVLWELSGEKRLLTPSTQIYKRCPSPVLKFKSPDGATLLPHAWHIFHVRSCGGEPVLVELYSEARRPVFLCK